MGDNTPRFVDLLRGEAEETWTTSFGTTGRVFTGSGIEAVWVSKENETIDPDWFSRETVDLIVVLRGRLRIEFAEGRDETRTMEPGQMLILPPNTRCRAYRWPRDSRDPAVFLAVYPQMSHGSHA
jgi:quercetin dioxygenase-like cupin family protein